MGPKKNPTNATNQKNDSAEPTDDVTTDVSSMLEVMRSIQAQLSDITVKVSKIENIETEVKSMKVILTDLKNESKQLKAEVRDCEKKIADMNERNNQLENRLHNLEQHHRGWSARVLNVPISPEDETNNFKVRDAVYNAALRPILEGAVQRNILSEVPTADQLLEMAHVLPGKAGQPKPIILRFFNRNMRDIIFKMKKLYAPRQNQNGRDGGGETGGGNGTGGTSGARGTSGGGGGGEERGRFVYPIYEDLTRATFQKMRAISQDSRVKSCWTVKGQIKFKT